MGITGRLEFCVVLVVASALMMGCAGSPKVTPSSSQSPQPSPTVTLPSPASPTATTKTSDPNVPTFEMVCEAPADAEMSWIDRNMNGGKELPRKDAQRVKIGDGLTVGETWWVVGWRSHVSGTYRIYSYLTNASSPVKPSGERWIPVSETDWSGVSWKGDRLARGQEALGLLLSCLPPTS